MKRKILDGDFICNAEARKEGVYATLIYLNVTWVWEQRIVISGDSDFITNEFGLSSRDGGE
ncbi:MAG: hypothetical protein ACLUDU_16905 [Butyricimonas faecihominis]